MDILIAIVGFIAGCIVGLVIAGRIVAKQIESRLGTQALVEYLNKARQGY